MRLRLHRSQEARILTMHHYLLKHISSENIGSGYQEKQMLDEICQQRNDFRDARKLFKKDISLCNHPPLCVGEYRIDWL